jgi:hypothetical protein
MNETNGLAIAERDLLHEATLPVLGVPVRLRSDSPEVVQAFERAFAGWRVLEERPELIAPLGVEGRLVIHGGDEGGQAPAPVRHRILSDRRMLVGTPGSVFVSDAGRREFDGWVTRALLRDDEHFRHHVLESLVLAVVSWLDRTPVHAAAVVRDGAGLLLAGPSGRGKSTLTWAAARSGLGVLADDMVYVQLEPLRVWGMPSLLRLPAESARFFPELAGLEPEIAPSGKRKLALDLRERAAAASFPMVERMGVCVLERGGGPPAARRLDPRELTDAIGPLDPGFHLFAALYPPLLDALARRGGWALQVGPDPDAAARVLHRLLDEVG